jgi:hypothetical protein
VLSFERLRILPMAAQIVVTVRIPRAIGALMAVSGCAYVAQGIVVGADGFSSNVVIPALLALVLDLVWMVWLTIVAWQKPQTVRAMATAPVSPLAPGVDRDPDFVRGAQA